MSKSTFAWVHPPLKSKGYTFFCLHKHERESLKLFHLCALAHFNLEENAFTWCDKMWCAHDSGGRYPGFSNWMNIYWIESSQTKNWSLFHCLGRLPNTSTFYVPSSPFFRLQHIWKCAQKTQTFAMNVLLYFASICHSTKDSQCWLLNKLFCFLCLQVYFDCHIFCFEMSQEKPEGGGK